jgi:hypothetical protein
MGYYDQEQQPQNDAAEYSNQDLISHAPVPPQSPQYDRIIQEEKVANFISQTSPYKTVSKIDDVLHRIVDSQWSEIDKPDVFITYKDNTLTFQLTEELHGTYILDEQFQPVKKRKVRWDGDTELNFFVTEYNDPNILHKSIVMTLSDIVEKDYVVELSDLPEKFSVYTRRIFKNYVINKI